MKIYDINPGVGIGPVKLGSSPDDVRAVMGSAPHRFMKTPQSEHATEAWDAFHVYYRGSPPTVEFIELENSSEFRVRYKELTYSRPGRATLLLSCPQTRRMTRAIGSWDTPTFFRPWN